MYKKSTISVKWHDKNKYSYDTKTYYMYLVKSL